MGVVNLVLLIDESAPCIIWPKETIDEVIPDRDGVAQCARAYSLPGKKALRCGMQGVNLSFKLFDSTI